MLQSISPNNVLGFPFKLKLWTCRFIRTEEDDEHGQPWEIALASKYYSKLFREYAIIDLSRYKVSPSINLKWLPAAQPVTARLYNMPLARTLQGQYQNKALLCACSKLDILHPQEGKVGCRWRTHAEVIAGRGQFQCGAKGCSKTEALDTFEVPFRYWEAGKDKQALVKVFVPKGALSIWSCLIEMITPSN